MKRIILIALLLIFGFGKNTPTKPKSVTSNLYVGETDTKYIGRIVVTGDTNESYTMKTIRFPEVS